jgi:hypothetical protein
MKINLFVITILLITGINLTSCDLFAGDDDKSTVYYKSYFLGANSFSLDGQIYGHKGQNLSAGTLGKNLTAKIYYLDSDWEIKSSLNGNNFDFQISTTSDGGVVLSKDTPTMSTHSIYEYFIAYFNHLSIPYDGPEGRVKIYQLSFELDNDSGLKEYESSERFNYDEHFSYVYVTEPVDMSGNFHWKDEYNNSFWYYDCNFSQAGWYKIGLFYDHSIGNNPHYSSSKKIKLRTYE